MLALTFQVGRDRVALDVHHIREVVPRVHLQVPAGSPPWLAGLFVHRGRAVPVIDLFRLSGAGECPMHLSSRIILVPRPGAEADSLLGLLATQVADLREIAIPKTALLDLATAHQAKLGPLLAEGSSTIRVMDPSKLLPAEAIATLGTVVAEAA